MNRFAYTVLVYVLLLLALFACSSIQSENTPSITQESNPTPTRQLTATLAPTTTQLPRRVVLLAPSGSEQAIVDELAGVLEELSNQQGLRFETRQSLGPTDFEADGIILVIALPGDPGLKELINQAPKTQFLAIDYPDMQLGSNLSLIQTSRDRPDTPAFIAGYIAAVVTTDWRAGVIIPAGSSVGEVIRESFANGMYFFCGLCRSVYPPYPIPGYPLFYELSPGATLNDWQAGIDYFKEWQVQTVYVSKPVDEDPLLTALAQAGFNLITARKPPTGMEASWIASISSGDIGGKIRALFPKLLGGEGGQSIVLAPVIEAANPDLFSPGRQNMVEVMIADLTAGYIDIGVNGP